jgi:hypothetical protein
VLVHGRDAERGAGVVADIETPVSPLGFLHVIRHSMARFSARSAGPSRSANSPKLEASGGGADFLAAPFTA